MEAFQERNLHYEKYKFLRGSMIIIEGNISSGKSTLCRSVVNYLNRIGLKAKLYDEPILSSYLDLFLTDMKKYAFGFQMSMLIERQCLYRNAQVFSDDGGIAIIDRSMHGDKVFALLHYKNGNIKPKEMNSYDDVFSRLKFKAPSFVLYLEVDPEILAERCDRRNRGCESSVYSLEYFKNLSQIYDDVIPNMTTTNGIIRFDWNEDIEPEDFEQTTIYVLDKMRNSYFYL